MLQSVDHKESDMTQELNDKMLQATVTLEWRAWKSAGKEQTGDISLLMHPVTSYVLPGTKIILNLQYSLQA